MTVGCATRNHRWDGGDPPKCRDCGKIKGSRPRRKPPEGESTPPPAGRRGPNEALRSRWGLHQPAQPAQPAQGPAQEPTEQEEKPSKPKSAKVDVTGFLKGELPDLIIAGEQKTIRWLGRKPEEPADTLKAKFDEGFEKLSSENLPKIEISPLGACILFGVLLWGQMFIQGGPLDEKPAKSPARTKATAEGSTGKVIEAEFRVNSGQPATTAKEETAIVDSGAATGAKGSASDD